MSKKISVPGVVSDQDAQAALRRWRQEGSYRGFSDVVGQEHEDAGFLAGFEAGWDQLRRRVTAEIEALGNEAPLREFLQEEGRVIPRSHYCDSGNCYICGDGRE